MNSLEQHRFRHARDLVAGAVVCWLGVCASVADGATIQKIRRMTTEYDSLQSSRTHVETTILNRTLAETYRQEFRKSASRAEFRDMMKRLMKDQPGVTVQDFRVSYKGLDAPGKPFTFVVAYREQGRLFSKGKNGAYSRNGRLPPSTPNMDEQYSLIFPKGMVLAHATSGARGKAPDGRDGLVWKPTKRAPEPYYLEIRRHAPSPGKKLQPPPRHAVPTKKPSPPSPAVAPPAKRPSVSSPTPKSPARPGPRAAGAASIGVVQRRGASLVIDVQYRELSPGTVVRADLVQMPATVVQSIPAVVPPTRKAVLEFHPPLLGWPEGHYKIEVWANDKPLAKREILLRDHPR